MLLGNVSSGIVVNQMDHRVLPRFFPRQMDVSLQNQSVEKTSSTNAAVLDRRALHLQKRLVLHLQFLQYLLLLFPRAPLYILWPFICRTKAPFLRVKRSV